MDTANRVESPEDFVSGDAAEDSDMDIEVNFRFPYKDSDDSETRSQQQSYTILSEADIRKRQEDDITDISSMLSISRVDAGLLLRHCNWSVSKIHDEWFVHEERIRKAVGLLQNPVGEFPSESELTCDLCLKTFLKDDIYTAACGHPFCSSCWAGYISAAVNDGTGCLMLRCPDPTCGAAVGGDMINVLASEDDRGKYAHYFLRSYIEDNRKVKWCPAGCDYAVEFVGGSGSYDVTCRCSYSFCWNCTEEAHRPVDCGTVANWFSTNTAVSKDMNRILADNKKCPKCDISIEKNQGSMRITCKPPCTFEFCWICLGPWAKHEKGNGGFYACNRYETAKQGECFDKSNKLLDKYSLERYTHYYERWAANQSSRQKAAEDLQQIQNVHLQQLIDKHGQSKSELKFITEAWSQIVECRQVLKWTYAYGCLLPEHKHAKRQLFEYLQGEAEVNLEQLHYCAENEMQIHLFPERPSRNFIQFHTKLDSLTRLTRKYFENLEEEVSLGCESSSKVRSKTAKGGTLVEPRWEIDDFWPCDLCTYANPFSASTCLLCVQPMEEN